MTSHISLFEELTQINAGLFVRDRNTWSRIHTDEKWRVYEGPIEIWFQNAELNEDKLEILTNLLERIPKLTTIKFNDTNIAESWITKIKELWPNVTIEIMENT